MKIDNVLSPKGIYAAVATPIDKNLKPDLCRYLDHCQWLIENGCNGLAALGTTGEANSIGLSTKIKLVEFLHAKGMNMKQMIIGTGSTSVEDTVTLSKCALQSGASGLLILPPYYYNNPTEDGLFNFYVSVAERLVDYKPQIYLYHIPKLSGVPITIELTSRLRNTYPGVFVGIKDSDGDFSYTLSFIKAFPNFAAFSGSEIFLMQNLIAGGWGCISATVNFTAPMLAYRVNNLSKDARKLDKTIIELRSRLSAQGTIGGTKAYLALYKNDYAWVETLPPNSPTEMKSLSLSSLLSDLEPIDEVKQIFGNNINDYSSSNAN